jgi:hypothetical protein
LEIDKRVREGQINIMITFFVHTYSLWPEVAGGSLLENKLAPEWLTKYLAVKSSVDRGDTLVRL